jgi:hypothetical protein
MIETQLSPEGEPVLGLYLHVAYHRVMASFGRKVGHGEVTPAIIGAVALIAEYPGYQSGDTGQTDRPRARDDRHDCRTGHQRRASWRGGTRTATPGVITLSLTSSGQRMLRTLRRRIAAHEAAAGAHLSAEERRTLRALLHKLVYG